MIPVRVSLTGVPGSSWKSWNSCLSHNPPLPAFRSLIVTSAHVKEAETSSIDVRSDRESIPPPAAGGPGGEFYLLSVSLRSL